jgi:hypothetical protein
MFTDYVLACVLVRLFQVTCHLPHRRLPFERDARPGTSSVTRRSIEEPLVPDSAACPRSGGISKDDRIDPSLWSIASTVCIGQSRRGTLLLRRDGLVLHQATTIIIIIIIEEISVKAQAIDLIPSKSEKYTRSLDTGWVGLPRTYAMSTRVCS